MSLDSLLTTSSSAFSRALEGKNEGRAPVWLMRQAGRYMAEYRALRARHSIMQMFRTPDLIREVTLQPIEKLGVDAAILFSDILILFDMLGVEWTIEPGVGPVVKTTTTLDFRSPEEAVPFLGVGIRQLREELTVPLIGFCGAPFTLASYLLEGGSSKTLSKTRAMMYRAPEKFHALLDQLADAAIALLRFQIDAGVEAVQIFDSWAHWLAPQQLREFSMRYLKKISDAVDVPVILFSRGPHATLYSEIGPVSLDWQCNLAAVRLHTDVPLQGNLDPALLYADQATITRETTRLLNSMAGDPAYIFNLGHGVYPDIPVDNVRHLVDVVKGHD
jgi:uroporphyrinogen decarboxylase